MLGTVDEQITIEKERREETLNKYINSVYENLNAGRADETNVGRVLIKLGHPEVTKKIQEFIDSPTTGARKKDKDYLLNICDDPKVLAYITLTVILNSVVLKKNILPITLASSAIMRFLYKEYVMTKLEEQNPKLFSYMDSAFRRASKRRREEMLKKHTRSLRDDAELLSAKADYPSAANLRVGAILVDCVIASGVNIFERGVHIKQGKRQGVLSLSEAGKNLMTETHHAVVGRLMSTYPPMVVPPKPWTTNYDGGFYTARNPIMKMKTPESMNMLKSIEIPKLYPVLNRLQATPWRINTFVLDVISKIFEDNMLDPQSPRNLKRLFGGLPTSVPVKVEDIVRKQDFGPIDEDTGYFTNNEDFVRWRRLHESVRISLDGELGRRIQLMGAIGEAHRFRDYDELYFAYNLDSRGRVYTLQAVITPQSTSTIKAMLEFAHGQLLDADGVYWLKIHTANVFGNDKDEFADRIKWFEANEETILAVGSDPFGNLKHWAYSDSPFEFLAACKAWYDHTQGKEVHLGIQLDATNSGVQIYSGLLGDLDGAKTVNVVSTGKREDVYAIVAAKVNEKLAARKYPEFFEVGLSDGTSKKQSTLVEAKSITGKVTRSIVKRNVMTVPYSVSRRGMSQQLWDIMDDAQLEEKVWWEGDPWVVNKLLTDLNHEAIYETIHGAKVGQDYLVSLAELCSDKEGMVYYTPIYEIPVIQKKPKTTASKVKTIMGSLTFYTYVKDSLDRMAQRNGSAPNYIHSIDSTLLLRVIETMSTQIGVIHDCFIVPPNQGSEVQQRFKEAYVEIMKMKPLELLGKQLDPEGTIEVPYIGTLNLDDVLDAEYIIS